MKMTLKIPCFLTPKSPGGGLKILPVGFKPPWGDGGVECEGKRMHSRVKNKSQ